MLGRVISGGQTGADRGGIRAARACGIPTGGFMALGFLTESGPCPDFAGMYGAVELATADYAARTRANAREANATIRFGDPGSPGGRTTLRACARLGLPVLQVIDGMTRPSDVAAWIAAGEIRVLDVAGNRESMAPGIGERTERFMLDVFRRLAEG